VKANRYCYWGIVMSRSGTVCLGVTSSATGVRSRSVVQSNREEARAGDGAERRRARPGDELKRRGELVIRGDR